MSQRLLVTRPEHDDTTTYLSHYAKLVIKYAEDKGVLVTDFKPGTIKKEIIGKKKAKDFFCLLNFSYENNN